MGKSKRKRFTKKERREYALRSQPEETLHKAPEESENKQRIIIFDDMEPWKSAVDDLPFPEPEIKAPDSIDLKSMIAY